MEKVKEKSHKDSESHKADDELMHGFKTTSRMFSTKLLGILLIVALLGVGSGYFLSQQSNNSSVTPGKRLLGSGVEKGKTYGEGDAKEFKDTAEGVLKEGGVEGEGQYHLERPGGDSQNVYLTSSQVDLSLFIDRKVKVWGATQKAQYAGWLMDVGRVQVLE